MTIKGLVRGVRDHDGRNAHAETRAQRAPELHAVKATAPGVSSGNPTVLPIAANDAGRT